MYIKNDKLTGMLLSETKVAWHRPKIERIDIKRTMGGAGSWGDSPTGTTSFKP